MTEPLDATFAGTSFDERLEGLNWLRLRLQLIALPLAASLSLTAGASARVSIVPRAIDLAAAAPSVVVGR